MSVLIKNKKNNANYIKNEVLPTVNDYLFNSPLKIKEKVKIISKNKEFSINKCIFIEF